MIKKISILAICLVILSTIILGCTGSQTTPTAIPSAAPAATQELTVAMATDVVANKLDACSYNGAIDVYPMVYDALVEYGDDGSIIPGLATSWDIADGEKGEMIITFHLRQGVKFSDGTPFNAEAVNFSLTRTKLLNPKDQTAMIRYLTSIEVVDDSTVKLHYNSYLYSVLKQLTFPRPIRILSPSAVSPYGDSNGTFVKPIGTGQWIIENYVKDQYTELVPNQNYWGEKPKLDKITFKIIPDPQTRALAVQSGDVDMAGGACIGSLPSESISVLKKDSKLNVEEKVSTQSYYLIFRYDRAPFNDINVRKAVNYAVDKDAIAKVIGIGDAADGFFSPTVDYVTAENSYSYPYDADKAKQALADSGWKDTNGDGYVDRDGKPLEISLVYQTTSYPEWGKMCTHIQESMRKVGIKVNLLNLESAAYYDRLWTSRDFDLIIYRSYQAQWNPEGMLTSHFVYPSSVGNTTAVTYGSEKFNELIQQVLTTKQEDKRIALYNQIFKLMYDEAACVPLYYCEENFAVNSKVKGFEFGSNEYQPVKWEKLWISS